MPRTDSTTPAALDESRVRARLLVRGLRREGAGKLCKEEPSDFTLGSELLSVALLCSASSSSPSTSLGGPSGAGRSLGPDAGRRGCRRELTAPPVPYLIVLLGWAIAAVVQLAGPGLGALALTHGLPFAIVLGARWAWRALRLAAGIPLFVPVALIVVLSPLLSEDEPWSSLTWPGSRQAKRALELSDVRVEDSLLERGRDVSVS